MIQVNELRIGNWVKSIIPHDGKLVKFERFNEDFKVAFFNKEFIGAFIEHIQPIHLTPEILEKCGFVLDKGIGVWFNVSKRMTIAIWDSYSMDYKLSMADNNHILVNSLHQLQNLYFALTNEELIFKP